MSKEYITIDRYKPPLVLGDPQKNLDDWKVICILNMFLKITFLKLLMFNCVCVESSKLTHYETFMKLIEEDSNKYHDGCLLGEFLFTKYGYFEIPDFRPEKLTFAKFIIIFTEDDTLFEN